MQNISSILAKFQEKTAQKTGSNTQEISFAKFKRKEGTLDTVKRANMIQKAYIFATINNIIKLIQKENYPNLAEDFAVLEIMVTTNLETLQIKIKVTDRLFATFLKTEKGNLEYNIQQKILSTNLSQIQKINFIVN